MCLSTKTMLPTKLAFNSCSLNFNFSCAIIHIFRQPITVITGVDLRSFLASGVAKKEVAGSEAVKYQTA